jgi:hypothetical protein
VHTLHILKTQEDACLLSLCMNDCETVWNKKINRTKLNMHSLERRGGPGQARKREKEACLFSVCVSWRRCVYFLSSIYLRSTILLSIYPSIYHSFSIFIYLSIHPSHHLSSATRTPSSPHRSRFRRVCVRARQQWRGGKLMK